MITLVGNWWTFVLRGVLACIFGLMAFLLPGITLMTLVFVFGFYAIANGVFSIVAAFRREDAPNEPRWWALLLNGVVSILVGLIALFLPGITALTLAYLIAAWALLTGATEIVTAIRLRKQLTGEWLLILAGALSMILGFFIALFPGAGALAMVFWIGAYAFVFGVMLISLGIKLRKEGPATQPRSADRGMAGYAPSH